MDRLNEPPRGFENQKTILANVGHDEISVGLAHFIGPKIKLVSFFVRINTNEKVSAPPMHGNQINNYRVNLQRNWHIHRHIFLILSPGDRYDIHNNHYSPVVVRASLQYDAPAFRGLMVYNHEGPFMLIAKAGRTYEVYARDENVPPPPNGFYPQIATVDSTLEPDSTQNFEIDVNSCVVFRGPPLNNPENKRFGLFNIRVTQAQ